MRATTTAASNIRPAGHNPVHQAFLSSPRGLPETSKMTDLCLSGVFFSSSKIHQKSFSAPDHAEGAYDAPPDPLVGWGGGHPLPSPFPSSLDSFGISIWPPTSLKFVHLTLQSKRLDTPALQQPMTWDNSLAYAPYWIPDLQAEKFSDRGPWCISWATSWGLQAEPGMKLLVSCVSIGFGAIGSHSTKSFRSLPSPTINY